MSAKRFNYFDDAWKTEILECPKCHWLGTFEQGSVEYYAELMDSIPNVENSSPIGGTEDSRCWHAICSRVPAENGGARFPFVEQATDAVDVCLMVYRLGPDNLLRSGVHHRAQELARLCQGRWRV